MGDFTFLTNSTLCIPEELKYYLAKSKSIRPFLNEETMVNIEDYYLFSKAYNLFTDEEFGWYVIQTIKNPFSQFNSFINICKKYAETLEDCCISIDKEIVNRLFKRVSTEFIDLTTSIERNRKITNQKEIYKSLGQLELINQLIEDDYFLKIYNLGKEIVEVNKI